MKIFTSIIRDSRIPFAVGKVTFTLSNNFSSWCRTISVSPNIHFVRSTSLFCFIFVNRTDISTYVLKLVSALVVSTLVISTPMKHQSFPVRQPSKNYQTLHPWPMYIDRHKKVTLNFTLSLNKIQNPLKTNEKKGKEKYWKVKKAWPELSPKK